ncbi:unnamed protein product [Clonostachys rosea]|uniref:SGNH hydrolase-type esterase domain-containing protein n=1 Tax=Bionectria ochroleuca TaxID=29856 RepID=A0ABY6U8A3_BIOOC|nr:unnamed protein product [Clonostachys rosea]
MVCMSWAPGTDALTLHGHNHDRHAAIRDVPLPTRVQIRDELADGVELRVLPIGDSITYGAGSTNYNGYRKELYQKLKDHGNAIDFVGSMHSGDFADTDHEGHRGEVISTIQSMSQDGIYAAPNIVLLHAGTNDINRALDVGKAPDRLKTLIEDIYSHSEDALVLVAKIIPSKNQTAQADLAAYNKAIPNVVASFTNKHIAVVDMNSALTTADLTDSLHPTDAGYTKMANTWYDAIIDANSKGWIVKPGTAQDPPDSSANCRETPSWLKVGEVASGASVATTDGDFKPVWTKTGVIASGACPRARLHLMDLDGDGLKDYACVDPKTGATTVSINIPDSSGKSQNKWEAAEEVASGKSGRDGYGVMFADLNGDGADDYIYVDPDNGDVSAWINGGKKNGTWQWKSLGIIASGVGAKNTTLQMIDFDGDGRADFCIVDSSSSEVTGWLNTGASDTPNYHKLGVIATGASASKGNKVYLGDFTGNGRADYMIVGSGGQTKGLVNRLQENSVIPAWLSVFDLAAGPDGVTQDQVRFVDMTGDGKVDYLAIDEKSGKVTLWENAGTGGKYQKGEGVVLCDCEFCLRPVPLSFDADCSIVDGDGTSDYFWLDHEGRGWGYLNTGKGKNQWQNLGNIANGDKRDRSQIRMGVLTTSGRADCIVVDDKTGQANWWKNLGESNNYGWSSQGEAAAGPKKTIEDTYGWKFKGKNVRFADLNYDGLDDYIYVNEQGAVVMWPNLGKTPIAWGSARKVADGVGALPRDIHFADTNGDGKLDYVVVDRVSGAARTWLHGGFRSDNSIAWNSPISFADGPGSVGPSVEITEMTGDKRADYVSVDPNSGRLNLWQNRCWAK